MTDQTLSDINVLPDSPEERSLRESLRVLSNLLVDLVRRAKRKAAKGQVVLVMPCVSDAYIGTWPDDALYPFMALPDLVDVGELTEHLAFLASSVLDLPYVPDRIEQDGLPILSPGAAGSAPMTDRMPLHLPAAWIRLLDYYQSFGVHVARKEEWARLIIRSFERVPFSCGLAYADPQRPPIGFGFYDSIRISGHELMSSLMLYRGFQRAAVLFADVVDQNTLATWRHRAEAIRVNIDRCYDEDQGGFVGGTRLGRQFSVWANGLIFPLASAGQQAAIMDTLRRHRDAIFLHGCTRQVSEVEGWKGSPAPGGYQNGGFWATGTGYVLPAIAAKDPVWATELATELVDYIAGIDIAEWIDVEGRPHGARQFLASVAVPILGLRCILERKSLIQCM